MSSNEKKISFLNNYFVFKKVHDVNAGKVSLVITDETKENIEEEEEEGEELTEVAKIKESKVTDLNQKIQL